MNEKKLRKNKKAGTISGVCAGIADYFNIDVAIVRLVWVLLAMVYGGGILAYIICALIMPDE